MPTVLSTKVLSPKLKKDFFAAGIGLVEYDAIKIFPNEISFKNNFFENAIFSSKNAVNLAFEKHKLKFKKVYCVGKKTAELIQSYGLKPEVTAQNAKQLAEHLVRDFSKQEFNFFCSSQRREELPGLLRDNHVSIKEHYLYHSTSDKRTFSNDFDAVLCFSPLGVEAYYNNNTFKPTAICIGKTTADKARKFQVKVITSSQTSIESVIVKTVKYFYNK